jgi:hypothetical protein
MPAEMGTVEIPTVPGAPDATVAEQNEHQDRDDHGNSPASENKENEERDRSRSPRGLNVPEPNPDNPLEVLSACASLAVGVTSMVAALKTSSEKLEVLIGNTQTLQNDLVRSMDTLATVSNPWQGACRITQEGLELCVESFKRCASILNGLWTAALAT